MNEQRQYEPILVTRLLLGIFASLGVLWLLVYIASPENAKKTGADAHPLIFLFNTFSFQLVTLVFTAVFLKHHNVKWSEAFGLRSSNYFFVIIASVVGLLIFVPCGIELQRLVKMAIDYFSKETVTVEPQIVVQILQKEIPFSYKALIGISTIVLAPIAEEVLFRGLLYKAVKDAGHPLIAIYGVSLLFGLIHNNLAVAIPLAFFGVILTILYEITGNLLTPILTHSMFNCLNFVMLMNNLSFDRIVRSVIE